METCKTQRDMLKMLLESARLVMEGLGKFILEKKELGADQSLPAFSYVMLMAQPKMFVSCIKYYI